MIMIHEGALFGVKKNYFGPLETPCLERRLWIRVQLRPFQINLQEASYNRPNEGVGCKLGLKYALIVATIVSEVEIIQQSRN